MAWKNNRTDFGAISRILHWGMAALILWQLSLGLMIANIAPGMANLWLFGLHKTIGMVALVMVLGRIIWHRYNPPPGDFGVTRRKTIAKVAHIALYLCMIALPLTGWVASSATGLDVVIFGYIALPAIAPVSPVWEEVGFIIHNTTGKVMMLILLLHILGAVTQRDGVLARMIWG